MLLAMKEYCEVSGPKVGHRDYELEQATDQAMEINQELMVRTRELEQSRQELSQINLSLETRVSERTAQLEAANKVLAAANKQLESFGHSLTHDLKSSLMMVSIAAEILNEDQTGLNKEQRVWAQHIADGSQRM